MKWLLSTFVGLATVISLVGPAQAQVNSREGNALSFQINDVEYARISETAGNLGIGTTNPLAKLTINGTISASDAIQVGTSSLTCTAGVPGAIRYNSGNIQFCNGSAWATVGTSTAPGSSGDIVFNNGSGFAADTGQLYWDATNNRLGIGTGTPAKSLDVVGQISATSTINSSWQGTVTASNTAPTSTVGILGGQVNGAYWVGVAGRSSPGNGVGVYGEAGNASGFGGYFVNTAGGPALIANGTVGIGTTAPAAKLHISGDAGASWLNSALWFTNTGTGTRAYSMGPRTDGNFYVGDETAGVSRITLESAGDVGIGTTNPNAKLEVNGTVSATTIIAAPPMMVVVDEKAAGTAGGTCTSGSWFTRVLNTVRVNTITGASLSSNQVTLPAGTYLIRAKGTALAVNRSQSRLYNATDGSVIAYGTNAYGSSSAPLTMTVSEVVTQLTITGTKAVQLEHRCQSTQATNGLGQDNGFSSLEVYSSMEITKLQ